MVTSASIAKKLLLPSLSYRTVSWSHNSRIMFSSYTNNAQIVFPLKAELYLREGSLYHVEDQLNQGKLEMRLNKEGLVLLELKNGSYLTGNTYRLIDGKIEKGPSKKDIVLSEVFVAQAMEI